MGVVGPVGVPGDAGPMEIGLMGLMGPRRMGMKERRRLKMRQQKADAFWVSGLERKKESKLVGRAGLEVRATMGLADWVKLPAKNASGKRELYREVRPGTYERLTAVEEAMDAAEKARADVAPVQERLKEGRGND